MLVIASAARDPQFRTRQQFRQLLIDPIAPRLRIKNAPRISQLRPDKFLRRHTVNLAAIQNAASFPQPPPMIL